MCIPYFPLKLESLLKYKIVCYLKREERERTTESLQVKFGEELYLKFCVEICGWLRRIVCALLNKKWQQNRAQTCLNKHRQLQCCKMMRRKIFCLTELNYDLQWVNWQWFCCLPAGMGQKPPSTERKDLWVWGVCWVLGPQKGQYWKYALWKVCVSAVQVVSLRF